MRVHGPSSCRACLRCIGEALEVRNTIHVICVQAHGFRLAQMGAKGRFCGGGTVEEVKWCSKKRW